MGDQALLTNRLALVVFYAVDRSNYTALLTKEIGQGRPTSLEQVVPAAARSQSICQDNSLVGRLVAGVGGANRLGVSAGTVKHGAAQYCFRFYACTIRVSCV